MAREPGYCLHKAKGLAYVRLGGKLHYLGEYGSEESYAKYAKLKSEWLTNRAAAKFSATPDGPTIAQVCLAFLDHAQTYYPKGNELRNYKLAIDPLSELYSDLPAAKFGPLEFETVRNWWLAKKCHRKAGKVSRQYVNKQLKRVMHIIKWAVAKGSIPVSVHQTLKCIAPLKRGRTEAREAEAIKPVSLEVIGATIEQLPRVVGDMVQLQLLLGARPGEIVKLTPAMVDRSSDVWVIALEEHKTSWRGKERTIYVGPRAQGILAKYLFREPDAFCFSPREALAQLRESKTAARTTPPSCGNRPGKRSNATPRGKGNPARLPGEAYTTMTYGGAIRYACDRAFPPPAEIKGDAKKVKEWKAAHRWAPNQLRHNRATEIRKGFGLEAAQVILGHASADTTQIYAEKDMALAISVAKAIG